MAGLFGKAMKDAASFSVTTTSDGARSFDRDKQDTDSQKPRGGYRGRNRGRSRGRGQDRGYWRGRGGYRGRGNRGRSQYQEASQRSYLNIDDDENMGDEDTPETFYSRFTPYGTRPPSRQGFHRDDRNKRGASDLRSRIGNQSQEKSDWYKVSVVRGKFHDKDWLLKKLRTFSGDAFQPVEFHYKGDTAMFFVEGSSVAEALKKVSHQITVKDGSKLILTVRSSDRPFMTNHGGGSRGGTFSAADNPESEQALKECLSKRYNAETKVMDLSNLFHDEVLKANGVQGSLSRYPLSNAILKLIGENCPDMQGLDLSDNRLYSLETVKELANYAPKLQHLKLSNNQIKNIEELDKLKGLSEIVTLSLDKNPLSEKFGVKGTTYISAVRIRFPKVKTLDDTEHAPPIGFDLTTTTALPTTKESYMGDPEIKKIILTFLEQYFKIYDSGDRQPLLDAYHDQAIFSMSVNTGSNNRGPSLADYMKNSRNILRRKEPDQRAASIKNNRLSVVALLNELPPTTHELSSFLIDVNLALSSCLSFSVRGLFQEGKHWRSFTRVFVALPAAGGNTLRIVNDELHIRSPSLAQIEAFRQQQASQTLPVASTSSTATSLPGLTNAPPSLTPGQQQIVVQFSRESHMNGEWSYKCLMENGWDYQKAAQVFTTLNSKGQIPPDAFTKT